MKSLLQAMRLFHYMVGITAPEPKDERKVFWIWVGSILFLILAGFGFVLFLIPRVLR